eukprot:5875339-Pyramimonas_sp.AAC.2
MARCRREDDIRFYLATWRVRFGSGASGTRQPPRAHWPAPTWSAPRCRARGAPGPRHLSRCRGSPPPAPPGPPPCGTPAPAQRGPTESSEQLASIDS